MRIHAIRRHWVAAWSLVWIPWSLVLGQSARLVRPDTARACASESDERGQTTGPHLDRSVRGILTDSVFARHRTELGLSPTTPMSTVTDAALCMRVIAALDAEERRGRVSAGWPVWVRRVGPYLAATDAVPVGGEWAILWILDREFRIRQRYTF